MNTEIHALKSSGIKRKVTSKRGSIQGGSRRDGRAV